jgi:transcription antitermination factor NusG
MSDPRLLPAWYVLHTRSRFEAVVQEGLMKKSHEVFLPRVRVRSRRRDRVVLLDVPLFPGYVFVRSDLHPHHHLDILKTAGVVRMIGNKDGPIPVPPEAVDSLRIMVQSGAPIATGTRFRRGDLVMVVNGPFTGVTGHFVRYRNADRVLVRIEALGQFAAVEVDAADVERVPAGGGGPDRTPRSSPPRSLT